MGLNSISFIGQFIALCLILFTLQLFRNKYNVQILARVQIYLLIVYSFYFIGVLDVRYAVCILIITVISYIIGVLINSAEEHGEEKYKRCIEILGIIFLVCFLVYFKYTNFFIESFNKAFDVDITTIKILLPLGVSFYVFSGLSYILDVYAGKCEAEKNVIDFVLYMSLFPKVTAGPIVRWVDFKPQIKSYRGIEKKALNDGVQIFLFGLFKKIVLADHLNVFVNDVFDVPNAFNTGTVVLSAVSYSLQIYLDFSGYSDMAIGTAKILGFDFEPNFNLPYIAVGFSDFWNRWHISLSRWFRDYLYIPLGGSRKGEKRTYCNLLFVMFVSGLWHGAGWTFILWGILHGVASCITRLFNRIVNVRDNNLIIKSLGMGITFAFATLFWTVFRAEDMEKLNIYWKALFTVHSGISQPYTWTIFAVVCVAVSSIIACIKARKGEMYNNNVNGFYPIVDLSKFGNMILFFTLIGITILMGYYGNTAFIYGGF